MKLKIRDFNERDLDVAVQIIKEGLGYKDAREAKEHFIEGINKKNTDYKFLKRRVAILENKIVGICGPYNLSKNPSKYAGICWFAVSKKHRNKGIGKELIKDSEEIARNKGYTSMYVWATRESKNFYIKRGFKKSNKLIRPKESNILMIKKIC